MDSLITAAARAFATGDRLGALKRVALRDDAPALALQRVAGRKVTSMPSRHRSSAKPSNAFSMGRYGNAAFALLAPFSLPGAIWTP
jgi:hypothetical protein